MQIKAQCELCGQIACCEKSHNMREIKMRTYITAAALILAATVGFAQETHFDINQCPNTPLGQLQEQAHVMLGEYGHGDYDVTKLTLDQLVKLMCIDPTTPAGKADIDKILGASN